MNNKPRRMFQLIVRYTTKGKGVMNDDENDNRVPSRVHNLILVGV